MTLRLAPTLALPAEAVTETFAILAKRGVGKSYLAAVMTEEMLKASLHVVVADPVGVFWGLRAAANGRDPGLPIIVMGGEHGDVPLEASAGKVVADFVVGERQSVVLDLSLLRKGEQVRFMAEFAETLYHRNRAPLHLVLDEADAFAPQRPMHDQARMLGAIEDLVRRGRARGIGVTLVTQRAAVLNKDVLTQVEVLVALRTIAPQDREAIDAWIKVHGTPQQREQLMASLPSLPIGEAWFWSPGWLDVFKRVKVRARETFDSSATPKVGARPPAPKQLAPVDLEALTKRIAATIEKAKAEDPRELRRRIAALEAELARAKAATAAPAKEKRVEVPILREAEIKRLEAAALKIGTAGDRIRDVGQAVAAAAAKLAAELAVWKMDLSRPPQPPFVRPTHLSGARHAPTPAVATARVPARPRGAGAGGDDLGAGERKMLEALALRYPTPLSKAQLGLLSGYTASGGTFRTYLPRLARLSFVDVAGDRVQLTETGLQLVGARIASAPQTAEAVRAMWLASLDQGPRRMLEVLIERYPKPTTREELGEASGYTAAGGTFRTYLPKLKRLGLVEVRGDEIRASEELFG